ncbi:Histidine--tRNA ligase [compost metagenome]
MSEIGGPEQPGIGLGLGLERIALILEKQQVEATKQQPLDIYLIALGEAAEAEVNTQLFKLRQAGVSADRDYLGRKMKAQMKSADRMKAKYTAILGDDELSRGEIALKNMETGEQRTVQLAELVQELSQH